MADGLRGPLTPNTIHLCLDMQWIFSSEGLWPTPWMDRVLPVVAGLAGRYPERTMFTRFITPSRAENMPGMWQAYYRKWHNATREKLAPGMLDLLPPLAALAPPATVVDKMRYSAFADSPLLSHLLDRQADGLIITGAETDVCVLATVLDAVDLGYRVIVARDAICSSSDEGHDAQMAVYRRRYGMQVEVADADDILARW